MSRMAGPEQRLTARPEGVSPATGRAARNAGRSGLGGRAGRRNLPPYARWAVFDGQVRQILSGRRGFRV